MVLAARFFSEPNPLALKIRLFIPSDETRILNKKTRVFDVDPAGSAQTQQQGAALNYNLHPVMIRNK
jgi:hypothetical protein